MAKQFLDYAGLKLFADHILALIKEGDSSIAEELAGLKALVGNSEEGESLISRIDALESAVGDVEQLEEGMKDLVSAILGESMRAQEAEKAIDDKVEALMGDGEGSIKDALTTEIAKLINDSEENPIDERFDTLKEIADWILESDENHSALKAEERLEALEGAAAKAEQEHLELFNSIQSISDLSILALFMDKVELPEDKTVAEALAELGENEMLVLPEGAEIAEDLVIPNGAVIDANGAKFTGDVVVAADAEVVIQNAVFAKPVVIKEAA